MTIERELRNFVDHYGLKETEEALEELKEKMEKEKKYKEE